ncbi:BREX-1 system phosphatase PglZ type A [Gordonia pseudamarae]|uniref:BREX-1 system phosphatase PglZ type A n=1 Tax=Gordonia pseudamarae TaxID=2831662 RepID=UPI001AF2F951|nr:BREX-1 system phosphatase PglZ type A [Gordonia pseudamarae]QHN27793.1 BREX-1 system phosphatase PglZ type A [Gordonia pseudamarae]
MSTTPTIAGHLADRFESQRIVVWHDTDSGYATEVDALAPTDVTVLRVADDEFAIKHRMLRDQPAVKFLVYRSGTVPEGVGNWLLDVELAYGPVFTADRAALIRADLGLSAPGAEELIVRCPAFFNDEKLVTNLRALPLIGDDLTVVRAQMCAVLLNQKEHSFSEITRTLLDQHARGDTTGVDALTSHDLVDFYWAGASSIYGYASQAPTMAGFVLWMFQRAVDGFEVTESNKARNLALDFRGFRDSKRSSAAMKELARTVEGNLDYADSVGDAAWETLKNEDIFEASEREVIRRLVDGIGNQTMPQRDIADAISARRRDSFWFDDYATLYEGLSAAAELLPAIRNATVHIADFADGLARYRDDWFRIDQRYRQFTQAYLTAEFKQPIEALADIVENTYVTDFLAPLGVAWQQQVDAVARWRTIGVTSQSAFYDHYVAPTLKGRKKAVVIVSDALRYEVADELSTKIRGENKFSATIEAMLGVLPSYTQLGMAALLPHTTLAHSDGGDPVLVDGQKSDGTANRSKILSAVDGVAIQARDFVEMKSAERRNLYSSNQVLYVYHDTIDATGDKAVSEHKTFTAAADAVRELIDIVKMLANANATNIIVTADHGFLYQRSKLAEHFTLTAKPHGEQIVKSARRYVLGRGLKDDPAFTTFKPGQVGLSGDLEIQIPSSIQRIVQPGAGFQFVHGGASLQEIVVPVIQINKSRSDTVEPVNVDIHPESDKITTGQIVVKLYQSAKVEPHKPARRLRAGLYFDNALISNEQEMTFDSTSDAGRDRFQSVTLLLSKDADQANGHGVEFRLSEPIEGTDQWKKYKSAPYTVKRAFAGDDGWDF